MTVKEEYGKRVVQELLLCEWGLYMVRASENNIEYENLF